MSHEDAVAALESAVRQDSGLEQAPATPSPVAPEGAENVASEVTPPVAPAPAVPQAPPAEPDVPTFFNPDQLDPALLPGWKQLQAAFTQKTQDLAEKSRAINQYGDPETLTEAVELYNRITDPDSWPQLAQELSEAMQEAGMSPAQANQLAVETVQQQAQEPSFLDGLDLSDPDLAPIAQSLKAQAQRTAQLEAQLASFQSDQQLRGEYEEAERAQQAHALNIQQQLVTIAQSNPAYTQDDMEDIVKLAPFFNDDFFQAQTAYENMAARRLSRYFEGKQASLTPSVQPPGTPGSSTATPVEEQTVEQVGKEMEEYFRGLQAAGELDF